MKRTVELPFDINDYFYMVYKWGVHSDLVRKIEITIDGLKFYSSNSAFTEYEIGVNVFYTKQEANERLEKLKEEQDNGDTINL